MSWLCEREREHGLERGGYLRYRGQPRRLSPSPEVRYYGGDRGPSRVPPYGGDRGLWTDVRPRRRKAREQVEDGRDRFREEQRYRGQKRQGRSRVRARYGSSRWGDVTVDSEDYSAINLTDCDRSYWPGNSHDNIARKHRYPSRRARRSFSRTKQQRGRASEFCATVQMHRRVSIQPGREPALGQQQPHTECAASHLGVQPVQSQQKQQGAVSQMGVQPSHSQQKQHVQPATLNGTKHNHFVSFYFTNVPKDISYRSLRHGFEVCGIMEDIYLAKKRNVNGAVFGFVRYSNVKDLDKLLKAVNNIWFGDFKVVAKVSAYDRYGHKRGEGRECGEGEKTKEGEKRNIVGGIVVEGEKRNVVGLSGGGILYGQGNSVVLGAKAVEPEKTVVVESEKDVGAAYQVFVPKYLSSVNDLSWATKGVVVSVLNGEVIPVLQRRIFDAGFDSLVIIPMGADKVFLRSLDDSDVSVLFSKAPDFFANFFSKPVRWSKDVLVRERGAWVRIYGVPLHAWNYDFFKLCVMDCGRLLRIDDITLERDRFDYARILLSTNSLEVINTEAQIMVDGVLFNFKIIEEWGYSLGEDACLLDEEQDFDEASSELPEAHVEDVDCGDVDVLVNHFSDKLKEDAGSQQRQYHPHVVSEPSSMAPVHPLPSVISKPQGLKLVELRSTLDANNVTIEVQSHVGVPPNNEAASAECGAKSSKLVTLERRMAKRTSSCPPPRARPEVQGPWSLEWATRNKRVESEYRMRSCLKGTDKITSKMPSRALKKKGSGHLRHCAQNLKRIARLSNKDRQEVLRALRRTSKQRRKASNGYKAQVTLSESNSASPSSVNNDWKHWLVLHGDEKTVNKDVSDIAHTVGIKFQGDKNNMFDVLSGTGRKNLGDGGDGK